MKLRSALIILSVLLANFVYAAEPLRFRGDGTFRVMQLTDLHYIADDPRCSGLLDRIKEMISSESPDLIIATGDLIYKKNAEKSIREVVQMLAGTGIPYGITFGNHDHEGGLSNEEPLKISLEYPHNLTASTEGISGTTNYCIEVRSHDADSLERILYIFDSHDYSPLRPLYRYDWIHHSQISWYRKASDAYADMNGDNRVKGAAYFHIPVSEFGKAVRTKKPRYSGSRMEKGGHTRMHNSLAGWFRHNGDVEVISVGHDHDNDFVAEWKGIALAYGRFSGGNTVYNNLRPSGARVIEFREGKEGFRTYIRQMDGKIVQEMEYPEFFLSGKWFRDVGGKSRR